MTEAEIFAEALGAEKHAIRDYGEYAEKTPDPQDIKLFQEIQGEEEHHLQELSTRAQEKGLSECDIDCIARLVVEGIINQGETINIIREAAKECREQYPSDNKAFVQCFTPAFGKITKGANPERKEILKPIWAEEFESAGGKFNPDNTVTLYHATTKEKAEQILREGILRKPADAPDSYGVYFSSSPTVAQDYGDGTLVKVTTPASILHPDDIFPGRRMDFTTPTKMGIFKPIKIEKGSNPGNNPPLGSESSKIKLFKTIARARTDYGSQLEDIDLPVTSLKNIEPDEIGFTWISKIPHLPKEIKDRYRLIHIPHISEREKLLAEHSNPEKEPTTQEIAGELSSYTQEIQSALDKISSPLRKQIVRIEYKPDLDAGAAITGRERDKVLYLNPSHLPKGRTLESAILHEAGHIASESRAGVPWGETDKWKEAQGWELKHGKGAAKHEIYWEPREASRVYNIFSPEQDFADAYAAFLLSPEALKAKSPIAFQFMQDLFAPAETSNPGKEPVKPEVVQELRGLRVIIGNIQAAQAEGWILDEGAKKQLDAALKRQAELTEKSEKHSNPGKESKSEMSLRLEDIKTIGDIDIYRQQNPIKGQIQSRYQTMVNLYGIDNADKMMRGLEIRSWK